MFIAALHMRRGAVRDCFKCQQILSIPQSGVTSTSFQYCHDSVGLQGDFDRGIQPKFCEITSPAPDDTMEDVLLRGCC